MRKLPKVVTENEKMVLQAIMDYKIVHGGNAPSCRTLGKILGMGRQTAYTATKRLESRGYIRFIDSELIVIGEQYIPPKTETLQMKTNRIIRSDQEELA